MIQKILNTNFGIFILIFRLTEENISLIGEANELKAKLETITKKLDERVSDLDVVGNDKQALEEEFKRMEKAKGEIELDLAQIMNQMESVKNEVRPIMLGL